MHGIRPAQIAGYRTRNSRTPRLPPRLQAAWPTRAFGIEAAARQHELDFLPLATERYFLAARQGRFSKMAASALLQALRSPEFRDSCRNLPGYDATGSGDIVSARGFLTAIGAGARLEG